MSAAHSRRAAWCPPLPRHRPPPALVACRCHRPSALVECCHLAPPLSSFAVVCHPDSAATDRPATSPRPHIAACSCAWRWVIQLASGSMFVIEASTHWRGGQHVSSSIFVATYNSLCTLHPSRACTLSAPPQQQSTSIEILTFPGGLGTCLQKGRGRSG